jgi:hypothetical protein
MATLKDAVEGAEQAARDSGLPIAVVDERHHADEFAERDPDGKSYGYCPEAALHILYPHGEVVRTVQPPPRRGRGDPAAVELVNRLIGPR